ncbi:MAG: CoA transferase [Betaproteobacteria bacterium]|jgi:formyl-CoA transferase
MGPFRGIGGLDLSRIVAGPLATQILADIGCDVVKVERPATGDDTRAWVPPHALGEGQETGAFLQSVNRGERSITIDLACLACADLVDRLAGRADVLLENHRVWSSVRCGLDSRTLSSRNPGLVHCSITGYGQQDPVQDFPAMTRSCRPTGG